MVFSPQNHEHFGSEAESRHAHSEGKDETDPSDIDESEHNRNVDENRAKHQNVPLEAL